MKLNGMDAVIRHLERGSRIEDPVKKIVKRHTSKMNTRAQRHAPVDSGDLRRSIVSVYYNNGLTGHVTAGIDYAPYVEYGTRFTHSQAFIRPAYYETVWDFQEELDKLVR